MEKNTHNHHIWAKIAVVAAVVSAIVGILGYCSVISNELKGVYLSDVNHTIPKGFEQHGKSKFNKPYFFNRIQIDGEKFDYGPVMHPAEGRPAKIAFDLSGLDAPDYFEATIGINDQPDGCDPKGGSTGSVVFKLLIDKENIDSWKIIRGPGKPLKIALPQGKSLLLEVTDSGDGNRCDGAVWADARLTYLDK